MSGALRSTGYLALTFGGGLALWKLLIRDETPENSERAKDLYDPGRESMTRIMSGKGFTDIKEYKAEVEAIKKRQMEEYAAQEQERIKADLEKRKEQEEAKKGKGWFS